MVWRGSDGMADKFLVGGSEAPLTDFDRSNRALKLFLA
jgi:hypothetical protein